MSEKRKPQWRQMSFETWLDRTSSPPIVWDADHHKLLKKKLRLVTSGETKRLMIFMPPRHGKSEMVTVNYAAWRLERDPMLNIIIGSHNQRLANRFSRKIRRILESHKFPLSKDSKAMDEWETAEGGGVRAVGVGAGITGFGGGLVIIDDPVKGRADAESQTFRDKTHEWFTDDIYTRLTPDGAVIVIQTRWHEDDLAGRLLDRAAKGEGDKWEVLKLPAFPGENDELGRKPGKALWPARFDEQRLEQIRKTQGHYGFESLYQQNPVARDGEKFKREWFKFVDAAPEGLTWIRGYDLAISTKTSADHTASFRVAKDKDDNFYIDGGFRKRIEYPEQRRYVLSRIREERDTLHFVEDAMHGRALVQGLREELRHDRSRVKLHPVNGDKLTRALLWTPFAEAGRVHLVRGEWNQAFIDECCSFPRGRHDDQIDAVSIAMAVIENRGGKGFHAFD